MSPQNASRKLPSPFSPSAHADGLHLHEGREMLITVHCSGCSVPESAFDLGLEALSSDAGWVLGYH